MICDLPYSIRRRLWGDLFTEGLRQGWIHLYRVPFTVDVVDAAIRQWQLSRSDGFVGDLLNNLPRHGGGIVVGAVGLICLEHREFGRMRPIRTFVSEHPIQLEDALESAHQATLQEQFRRDPKVQVRVQSI